MFDGISKLVEPASRTSTSPAAHIKNRNRYASPSCPGDAFRINDSSPYDHFRR